MFVADVDTPLVHAFVVIREKFGLSQVLSYYAPSYLLLAAFGAFAAVAAPAVFAAFAAFAASAAFFRVCFPLP